MPGYKAHALAGLVAAAFVLAIASWFGYFFSPHLVAFGIVTALLGALFPDIDVKSKVQKMLYAVLALVVIALYCIQYYRQAALLAAISFLPLIVNHRALFHSFWFILFFTIAVLLLAIFWFPFYRITFVMSAVFFLAGVFSHLILDFGLQRVWRNLW